MLLECKCCIFWKQTSLVDFLLLYKLSFINLFTKTIHGNFLKFKRKLNINRKLCIYINHTFLKEAQKLNRNKCLAKSAQVTDIVVIDGLITSWLINEIPQPFQWDTDVILALTLVVKSEGRSSSWQKNVGKKIQDQSKVKSKSSVSNGDIRFFQKCCCSWVFW